MCKNSAHMTPINMASHSHKYEPVAATDVCKNLAILHFAHFANLRRDESEFPFVLKYCKTSWNYSSDKLNQNAELENKALMCLHAHYRS